MPSVVRMCASRSQLVGKAGGDVLAAINRMPQLVEHRAHPVLVGHDIGQHAHVPFAVDVGAEGVRALAGLFVEVAAGDHIVDRQADSVVEFAAKLEDVGVRIDGVEVSREDRRRLLEEWVVIVPGTKLVD